MGIQLTEEQIEAIERKELIEEIKSLGKNYHFWKYTNKQLWHIRNKLRESIAKQEAECMEIAREYYKEKEMGIPNYIQRDGIFYVWNEYDLEYQPLESDVDYFETLKPEVQEGYKNKSKVLNKCFTNNIMQRFMKVD